MIQLYSQDSRIIKHVFAAAAGECGLEYDRTLTRNQIPRSADFVVTCGQLSAGLERFAAGLGAMPLVLPEAAEYLAEKGRRGHVTLIGSDHRDVRA